MPSAGKSCEGALELGSDRRVWVASRCEAQASRMWESPSVSCPLPMACLVLQDSPLPPQHPWGGHQMQGLSGCHSPPTLAPECWAMHLLTSGPHLRFLTTPVTTALSLPQSPVPMSRTPFDSLDSVSPPVLQSRESSRMTLQVDTSYLSTAHRHPGRL